MFHKVQVWDLFFSYCIINDFRFSLCQSNSNHFTDDTCILFSSSKLKTIESILNYDLECASIWFRANRLSLNVSKSKLLIFHSKQKKIDYSKIYIKLNGSKLIPSSVVKYLGLYIDNNLSWDHNTFQLSKKLSRTNGILCKLRHLTPKSTLVQSGDVPHYECIAAHFREVSGLDREALKNMQ